ncbi:hypothetical protein DESC_700222 [Desulfosarcina cetonica]|nr:hypothetical protein DESC_700222 [Desulfosarcina cetonica]
MGHGTGGHDHTGRQRAQNSFHPSSFALHHAHLLFFLGVSSSVGAKYGRRQKQVHLYRLQHWSDRDYPSGCVFWRQMIQDSPGFVVGQRIMVETAVVGLQFILDVEIRETLRVELLGQKKNAQKRFGAEVAPVEDSLGTHEDLFLTHGTKIAPLGIGHHGFNGGQGAHDDDIRIPQDHLFGGHVDEIGSLIMGQHDAAGGRYQPIGRGVPGLRAGGSADLPAEVEYPRALGHGNGGRDGGYPANAFVGIGTVLIGDGRCLATEQFAVEPDLGVIIRDKCLKGGRAAFAVIGDCHGQAGGRQVIQLLLKRGVDHQVHV